MFTSKCILGGRSIRALLKLFILIGVLALVVLAIGKTYQRWDNDPERGAIAINQGALGESYSTPQYVSQGWSPSDSLWFYNTTQGSALIPYDFFIALEQTNSPTLFRDNQHIDQFRYLPQKPTFFNPDGLPVGFVKDTYQGKDYMGYTCAACHTGQVNYKGQALRIDGGPSMADMVGFLTAMEDSLKTTQQNAEKKSRFVSKVLALKNSYSQVDEVEKDLAKWTTTLELYNAINHSHLDYGYARLDAFGRIYNRVLSHVINKAQLRVALLQTTNATGARLLSEEQVANVLQGINETIIGDEQFVLITQRLASTENHLPGLAPDDIARIRDAIFNEPNAPVSYPFLWDITHSDYVQWNGLAANAEIGPLGRNAGEVIGVFSILDWSAKKDSFSLSAFITGQKNKTHVIDFKSSIDLTNLERIESHLKSLQSPQWPEKILGAIDKDKAQKGQLVYNEYCGACHQVIERDNWQRLVVANMSSVAVVGTDPTMALNSVNYSGYAGNFESVYQAAGVGNVVIQQRAPVVQVLTAATQGVVATPDADKWFVRRIADWLYLLAKSFFDNNLKASVKTGNYNADTTANPYQSLLSYKARSLNGIWATAPYLHNGSVPDLWSLLLPAEERPAIFCVGNREFDPIKMGFVSDACDIANPKTKNRFVVEPIGNHNTGHEYGTGKDGKEKMTDEERWELIEYIKTL